MEAYQRLEQQWSEFNNLDPAGMVACSSGTAALHLAFECLGLPPGSEVIMSDFNMVACPRAAVMAGLRPVFVDCDERLVIDTGKVEVGPRVKALLATHIYGRRCDMEELAGVCGHYDLDLVEDLAEAHGVRPSRWTDAATWSFYRNKIIAGEEGGAVWFLDPKHADLARSLRSLGFTDAHDFMHAPRGHNYRMSNAHAELILRNWDSCPTEGMLPVRQRNMRLRQEAVLMYNEWWPDGSTEEVLMPVRDALWVYDLRIEGMTYEAQGEVVRALQAAGIAARHAFKPMSMQAEFRRGALLWNRMTNIRGDCEDVHPVAYRASREVIYLPLTPGLVTPESARRAFEVIRRVVRK